MGEATRWERLNVAKDGEANRDFKAGNRCTRVLAAISRLVDGWIDRGDGPGPDEDPFGPPLARDASARLLDVVRTARFDAPGPPFRAPIHVDGTSDDIHAVLRPPRRGATWCVLATPYGAFRRPGRLGGYELHARALAARGLGVAVIEPPFHGARTMRGQTSGHGFVRADLGHTARAILAYAAEVAALARFLREQRGATRVVGLAISIGGSALGLAAAVADGQHPAFDRLAFLAAADNPISYYATGSNRERRRHTLAGEGFDLAGVEDAFRPVAPSEHPPPPAPSLFAIPAHDLIVTTASQERWRARWGGERLDLPWEGHGVALASPSAARRLAAWLATTP